MKRLILGLWLVTWILLTDVVQAASPRESRELQMARSSIIATLVADMHPKAKYRCSEEEYACISASPAELGLALIASRNTVPSMKAFADLLSLRLDGGLRSDQTCYALNKGESFADVLAQVNAALLVDKCMAEVQAVIARNGKRLEGTEPNSVCADRAQIEQRKRELISAIKAGARCKSSDF